MWQAKLVQSLLQKAHPEKKFEIIGMTTAGDNNQAIALSQFQNKGVFTKELDQALVDTKQIHIAVHCMKDLPTVLPDGIVSGAVMERGAVGDALVLHPKHKAQGLKLETLPAGSVIGTSALRRTAVIAKNFPQLVCKDVRGNVNTRLRKLDSGEYDALILAHAGLLRLEMHERIDQVIDKEFGHAVGQGALCVVCRHDDAATLALLASLDHLPTRAACEAERGLLRYLEGGCKVPIAIRTEIDEKEALDVMLYGSVISLDGKQFVEGTLSEVLPIEPAKALEAARALGCRLGEALKNKGADRILAEIKGVAQREI